MKPYHRLLTALLCIALLAGCGIAQRSIEQVDAPRDASVEPTEGAPAPVVSLGSTILMDGELVSAAPALKLSFPSGASGELLALDVRVGQRVQAGDRIATIDDGELQRAVQDAERALERATEDRERAQTDAEETHEQQRVDAQEQYEEELRQAERTLAAAQNALERAGMQPLGAEAEAHDDYKQALDRPWEPQSIRDALYKEWQERITDRGLAERRLKDAELSLEAYALDLEAKEQDVVQAEEDLHRVELEEVERPEEDLSYERAVQDAQRKLAEAQDALADAQLCAPWVGLVTSIDATVGDRVGAGTPIVTLVDVSRLYFVTDNLSERHVARLKPGLQAEITLRAYPDTVVTGQIDSVIPQSEQAQGDEARFAAHIRLDETSLDLLPGMTGRVEVWTDTE
jgi:HlyD family secretion protein